MSEHDTFKPFLKEHTINKDNHFVAGWYIDTEVCDKLIKIFESPSSDKDKGPGTSGYEIKPDRKKSTDLGIFWPEAIKRNSTVRDYLKNLAQVRDHYVHKYDDLTHGGYFVEEHSFNIQKYAPNEGYFGWHCERDSYEDMQRCLVFMTYLNDVNDGGETEFKYQNLKVRPEKGLTLIWPTDFTHTHRGITSKTQTKYIATGWYVYLRNHPEKARLKWD